MSCWCRMIVSVESRLPCSSSFLPRRTHDVTQTVLRELFQGLDVIVVGDPGLTCIRESANYSPVRIDLWSLGEVVVLDDSSEEFLECGMRKPSSVGDLIQIQNYSHYSLTLKVTEWDRWERKQMRKHFVQCESNSVIIVVTCVIYSCTDLELHSQTDLAEKE